MSSPSPSSKQASSRSIQIRSSKNMDSKSISINLTPKVSDPSIFKQAWNVLHNVYQGIAESSFHDDPVSDSEIDNLGDFKGLNHTTTGLSETKFLDKDINNNVCYEEKLAGTATHQFGLLKDEYPPFSSELSSVEITEPETKSSSRSRPSKKSSTGLNSIMEESEIVGTHRSNQAEATAQEYHALLDGIKSYYPFANPPGPDASERTRSRKIQRARQMAQFIDCDSMNRSSGNTSFLNKNTRMRNSNRNHQNQNHVQTEETLLFHPQRRNRPQRPQHNNTYDYGFQRLSQLYPQGVSSHINPFLENPLQATDTGHYCSTEADYKYSQMFVQQNEGYLRNLNEQIQRLNDERYGTDQYQEVQHHDTSTQPMYHQQYAVPEVHNHARSKNYSANSSSQYEISQPNCSQNNNVNINLTLAVQQQNGDLLSSAPILVKYSTSGEDRNRLIPENLEIGATIRKPKADSSVQTDFLSDDDEDAGELVQHVVARLNDINPDTEIETIALSRGELQDYSNEESEFPSTIPSLQVSTHSFPETSSIVDALKFDYNWLRTIEVSKDALNYTGESFRNVLEMADEVVSNYLFPTDERKEFTDIELANGEHQVGVALMGLIGIPPQQRNRIYQTALENIEALKEISTGTLDVVGSVISWLTTVDDRNDANTDLINKARILATISTEMDPESEVWQQFEKDIAILTDSLTTSLNSGFEAAKSVTTKCIETIETATISSERPHSRPRSRQDNRQAEALPSNEVLLPSSKRSSSLSMEFNETPINNSESSYNGPGTRTNKQAETLPSNEALLPSSKRSTPLSMECNETPINNSEIYNGPGTRPNKQAEALPSNEVLLPSSKRSSSLPRKCSATPITSTENSYIGPQPGTNKQAEAVPNNEVLLSSSKRSTPLSMDCSETPMTSSECSYSGPGTKTNKQAEALPSNEALLPSSKRSSSLPMKCSKIPTSSTESSYNGPRTRTTKQVERLPRNEVLLPSSKRSSSKTSYKQILHEKQQHLAQTTRVPIPRCAYRSGGNNNSINTQNTRRARTIHGTNVTTNTQTNKAPGSYLTLHGSHSFHNRHTNSSSAAVPDYNKKKD